MAKGNRSYKGITPRHLSGGVKSGIIVMAVIIAFVAIIFWLQGEGLADQLQFLPYIKSYPERWDAEQIWIFKATSYFLGAISIGLFAVVMLKKR